MIQPLILTLGGRLVDLEHPERNVYDIEEIAHALSRLCRYTGHTRDFYSVAQHSVHVADLLPWPDGLAGLLHDATEAYIGDVSAPLKSLLPCYKRLERQLEAAVRAHFGLPAVLPECVKWADQVLLVTEMRDLLPSHPAIPPLLPPVQPMRETLVAWPPETARRRFLERYEAYTRQVSA